MPRDIDELVKVEILRLYLVTVTCDEVQSYLKGFPQMSNVQMDKDIYGLRIRNSVTAPTSPLMPSKVKGLDTLSWHVGSVVEDKSDVN